jgi:adenylosuccinate synthase
MNLMRKLARRGNIVRDNKGNVAPVIKTAADVPSLAPYITDTVRLLNVLVDEGKRIMLEGTQGSMLSLHHGAWPKSTSRDTNAGAWLSEAGLSPLVVDKVYGVARTFPIRVAGNSGPASGKEITWKDVSEYAGVEYVHSDNPQEIQGLIEITTATKRVRRVFEFCHDDFSKAISINRPDEVMLTFLDYLDINNAGKTTWEGLTEKTRSWVLAVEQRHNCYFRYLSTGPEQEAVIDRGQR